MECEFAQTFFERPSPPTEAEWARYRRHVAECETCPRGLARLTEAVQEELAVAHHLKGSTPTPVRRRWIRRNSFVALGGIAAAAATFAGIFSICQALPQDDGGPRQVVQQTSEAPTEIPATMINTPTGDNGTAGPVTGEGTPNSTPGAPPGGPLPTTMPQEPTAVQPTPAGGQLVLAGTWSFDVVAENVPLLSCTGVIDQMGTSLSMVVDCGVPFSGIFPSGSVDLNDGSFTLSGMLGSSEVIFKGTVTGDSIAGVLRGCLVSPCAGAGTDTTGTFAGSRVEG